MHKFIVTVKLDSGCKNRFYAIGRSVQEVQEAAEQKHEFCVVDVIAVRP